MPLIVDTDLSIDVDDAGALSVAHALADRGEADLLAVVHDTGWQLGVGGVSVINRYYGRDGMLVGAYRGTVGRPANTPGPDWTHSGRGVYVTPLLDRFPSTIRDARQADSALDVYRAVLRAAVDHSVVIASVGFLTAILELLQSPADRHSSLTGVELVRRKVKHIVIMGGRRTWVEWNFGACGSNGDCGAYNHLGRITHDALARWPNEVQYIAH